jgi:uncharacterized protein (DUF58 family)
VTARLSEAHIRQTIAERELQTWLVVDRSPRLDFGTAEAEKRQLVLAAAAAVGFLTNRDGNRIGAIFASADGSRIIPPRGSRRHFLAILADIASAPRQEGTGVTDLASALVRVSGAAQRRGLIVVISDFLVAPGWEHPLRMLTQRHDVLAVQVSDPRERELPDVGMVVLRDPATGIEHEVATHRRSVRDRFAQAAAERQAHIDAQMRLARVDHLVLSTDRSWLDDLVRFVAFRKVRMAVAARR